MTENTASDRGPMMDTSDRRPSGTGLRRLLWGLPAILFAVLAGLLLWGLDPARDPSEVPSVLIGKLAPDFALPPVKGRALGFSTGDLKGQVSLVNVFASWCVACRAEHPLLMRLKRSGAVAINGLNYKDQPDDAAKWLDTLGDPYTRTGADLDGRVAIDWGVYGVPETFVVDRDGRIVYKQIGQITAEILDRKIMPLIEKLKQ